MRQRQHQHQPDQPAPRRGPSRRHRIARIVVSGPSTTTKRSSRTCAGRPSTVVTTEALGDLVPSPRFPLSPPRIRHGFGSGRTNGAKENAAPLRQRAQVDGDASARPEGLGLHDGRRGRGVGAQHPPVTARRSLITAPDESLGTSTEIVGRSARATSPSSWPPSPVTPARGHWKAKSEESTWRLAVEQCDPDVDDREPGVHPLRHPRGPPSPRWGRSSAAPPAHHLVDELEAGALRQRLHLDVAHRVLPVPAGPLDAAAVAFGLPPMVSRSGTRSAIVSTVTLYRLARASRTTPAWASPMHQSTIRCVSWSC